jgi:hypothetical protein
MALLTFQNPSASLALMMSAAKKQFALSRVALSTIGREKAISYQYLSGK